MRPSVLVSLVFLLPFPAAAQVCRISAAGINQNRRITGAIHAECPDPIHSAPFGNWGVTSNFGQKGDSHQFDGWCHNTRVCDNSGACMLDCLDGWYEWNSCTDHTLYSAPNCSLYNSASCTEQVTSTGVNVHGTRTVDIAVSCPRDTDGDGVPDSGGCRDAVLYSSGSNFMSLYELDPVCCDQLVQTVYYSPVTLPLTCDSLGCAPAASPWLDPAFWDTPATPAKVFAQMAVVVNWGTFVDSGNRCNVAAASAQVVSAASFNGPNVAPQSIATILGTQLSPGTDQASAVPLPTTLAGVSVSVTDSAGAARLAPLFYVSPRQINYQVPAGTAAGPATITIAGSGVTRATGKLQIEAAAPGIFTANYDGKGAPAALALRTTNGETVSEPVFTCPTGAGSCVPAPIDLLSSSARVYLVLFGTGIRNRAALTSVSVTIDGVTVPVEYAGAQPEYIGLDQVNIPLPTELAHRGTVDLVLTVDSKPANTVQLNFR